MARGCGCQGELILSNGSISQFFEIVDAPILSNIRANIGRTNRSPISKAKNIVDIGTNSERIPRVTIIKPINSPYFIFSYVIFKPRFIDFHILTVDSYICEYIVFIVYEHFWTNKFI